MTALPIYLLETALIISLLFLFYRYLYYRIAYFNWSRYFLLSSLILAFAIPIVASFLQPPTAQYARIRGEFIHLIYTDSLSNYALIQFDSFSERSNFMNKFSILNILFTIWILGAILNLIRFLIQMRSIQKIGKNAKQVTEDKYTFVLVPEKEHVSFTFLRKIYLSDSVLALPRHERDEIIKHEKIHVDELHSLDVLFFEIACIVLWFNPFMRQIKLGVREVHEFVTDNILTGNRNKPDYSRLLVKMAQRKQVGSVRNFFSEEIITRVSLISFPESERFRKRRFWASVPVLALTLVALTYSISVLNASAGVRFFTGNEMIAPLNSNDYRVVSPFFLERKFTQSDGSVLVVSHPAVSYSVRSDSEILAVADGLVSEIEEKHDSNLKSFDLSLKTDDGANILYKNVFKTTVLVGNRVKKGDRIGETGDNRLYPILEFRATRNAKPFDPVFCY